MGGAAFDEKTMILMIWSVLELSRDLRIPFIEATCSPRLESVSAILLQEVQCVKYFVFICLCFLPG